MHFTIKGKQLDIGEAFRAYIEDRLTGILDKYFDQPFEVSVTLAREASGYRAAISAHAGRALHMESSAEAEEAYPAFDGAAERLAKRLRRHKGKLRDHHRGGLSEDQDDAAQGVPAQHYVLHGDSADEAEPYDHTGAPTVVAEMPDEVPLLSVSQAVMRLDLGDMTALMFRNAAHGDFNMVYRRTDGNIGWVAPHHKNGA